MAGKEPLSESQLNQLYRYGLSLCRESDNAFDLVQQAVERYLNRDGKIESPQFYLMRSVRNAFYDQVRHHRLHLVVGEGLQREQQLQIEEAPGPEDLVIRQQEVNQMMAMLKPPERELLYLWAVEEYSVSQIAEITGVPRGTLLSQLHRMKIRVRSQLAEFKNRSEPLVNQQDERTVISDKPEWGGVE
ncbi:MAG: sigma-70 family RNA polymerase sigma factor [Amphritea sp.]